MITTLLFDPGNSPRWRFFALWYFTTLLIIWNILGHTVLRFEQSHAQTLVGLATAISVQILLEWVDARAHGRPTRFSGGWKNFLNFLPPAIIPGLAVPMLMLSSDLLWPVAFAAALAIASKVLIRVPVGGGRWQHLFNPSNFGLTVTYLLFPWVGVAPGYHFTGNVTGWTNWIVPAVVLVTGVIVHALFTARLPLVLAWLAGFALQAVVRIWIFGLPWVVPFVPFTSAAAIVFTLYMIPDPATTPLAKGPQIAFGLSVAVVFGLLLVNHVVYTLFFALCLVSLGRGLILYGVAAREAYKVRRRPPVAAVANVA
ncbi:MAG TPA: enediyne biosynthesis protein UnbU [Vicinamibacteria bacterium]|nr:enediyne biosynthesis protein UnbU [Vicinamibacteria bacterium]